MSHKLELAGRVVVITGASSGVGRALAYEMASRGCKLVLAARREPALQEVAERCRTLGGSALVVQTDVSIEDEVTRLAQATLDAHGRIDIWVNNAGITLYSLLEKDSFDEHRRVLETNLFGAIYGARAVIPLFRQQTYGTLINLGSVLSEVGQAFVPSYVISKFGVRGLTEALRVEIADLPDVHVCTVLPFAIDTPHFQVGGNRIGKMPRAIPPTQSPEKVAKAIARLAEYPRRETHVPKIARLGVIFHTLFPRTSERLLLKTLRRWHLSDAPERNWSGNLFAPAEGEEAKVHGDRPPMLSTPHLIGWLALQLGKMQLENLFRFVRG